MPAARRLLELAPVLASTLARLSAPLPLINTVYLPRLMRARQNGDNVAGFIFPRSLSLAWHPHYSEI